MGFPEMAQAPRTAQRVLSARSGTLLLIDQKVGEGFSGSPVLRGSKVIGVVTDMDEQTTYAVEAVVVRASLEGWGVKLAGACIPGQSVTFDGIEYVRICPGIFTMGSASNDLYAEEDEKPPRHVPVGEFWIGRTEVTNAQYRRVRKSHQGEDRLPVVKITWAEANAACEHFGGRLPTEAEWEYAARAGTTTVWSFGEDATLTGEYAWYDQNAGDRPHPVAEKQANPWGLFDMHGNVWEWVADGALPGHRVLRGGAFNDPAKFVRSANKIGHKPDERKPNFGFRCARSPER